MDNSADSLEGFAIGVTADRRADEQISLLEGRGGECMYGATVRTHPIRPEAEIPAATLAFIASPPDIVIVTTGTGVRWWLDAADAMEVGDELNAALARTRIFARGPKAHGAAIAAGLEVEWSAPSGSIAETLDHVASIIEPRHRVAVQVDGSPHQPIIGQIEALGAQVTAVPVYRWTLPEDLAPAQALVHAVCERRLHAVTFTSRAAGENFARIATDMGLFDEVRLALLDDVLACCVGAVCAEGLYSFGPVGVVQPAQFRLGAMVTALTNELNRRAFAVTIGGRVVVVRGRQVVVDGESPVLLSVRERQLLGALVERPGAVRSKKQLVRDVWRSNESNPHVVEVTIGRLRRRLGPAGVGIETVMKRGYRVSAE